MPKTPEDFSDSPYPPEDIEDMEQGAEDYVESYIEQEEDYPDGGFFIDEEKNPTGNFSITTIL